MNEAVSLNFICRLEVNIAVIVSLNVFDTCQF